MTSIAQACVQLVKQVLFFVHTWKCPVIPDSESQVALNSISDCPCKKCSVPTEFAAEIPRLLIACFRSVVVLIGSVL